MLHKTEIPGIVSQHAIIGDRCRETHGVEGAFDVAAARLRREYLKVNEIRTEKDVNRRVNYHLVLVVEDPRQT